MDDATLLRRYVQERSESAFTELVRRYVNLVYGAALRQTGGDAALAADVVQTVFIDLARKARSLTGRPVLTGWLHTSTRFAAAKARRQEGRRRAREGQAFSMHDANQDTVNWEHLRPVIDEGLHTLDDVDREAVLLRFFEGRAFAEIGTVLCLSEDAARKRVDRALDRLAAALSRQGITSTASALSLVLGRQSFVAAPAGLAAGVAKAALTAAAGMGASTGTVAWLVNAVRVSGSKVVAGAVLGISLAGNVWLAAHVRSDKTPSEVPRVTTRDEAPPAVAFAVLRQGDLAVVRDQLRRAGMSEASLRATLEGLLRRAYRAKLSELHAERYRHHWWRRPELALGLVGRPIPADDPHLLRTMVREPLRDLVGPDPLAAAEVAARYHYLPVELHGPMAALDDEREQANARRRTAPFDGSTPEVDRQLASIQARRDALTAALPAEQRHEFELRNATHAVPLMRRMELISGTETEYRTIFPIVEAYGKSVALLPVGEATFTARQALDQATGQEIVGALGFDRAVGYIWSGVWEYASYARVVREAGLPASTVGRIFQLAAETAHEASVVHYAADLSVEQKRAALVALQRRVEPVLEELLPASLQQRLPADALSWYTGLGEGSYRFIVTTLQGNSGSILSLGGGRIGSGPVPPPARRRSQLLPIRPAN